VFRNLYSGIGITNTNPLRPNFEPFFAFRNHFQKTNSAACRSYLFHTYIYMCVYFHTTSSEDNKFFMDTYLSQFFIGRWFNFDVEAHYPKSRQLGKEHNFCKTFDTVLLVM
jgi:hypothetical protein